MSDIEAKVMESFGDVIQEEDLDMDRTLVTNEDCVEEC